MISSQHKNKIKAALKSCVVGAMVFALTSNCISNVNASYFSDLEAKKANAHAIAEEYRNIGRLEDSAEIITAKRTWHEAQAQIDRELDILARVIYFEAGSSWLSDRHQQLVACVVLNRCKDERFPDTIEENIYREGQYACAEKLYSVTREQIPERCYENARIAAYGMVDCDAGVIYQAQFKQGTGTYERHGDTWFCYG